MNRAQTNSKQVKVWLSTSVLLISISFCLFLLQPTLNSPFPCSTPKHQNNFVHSHIAAITSHYKFHIIPQAFSNISGINFPHSSFPKYPSPRLWVTPSVVFSQSLIWDMLFGLPYILCLSVCVSRWGLLFLLSLVVFLSLLSVNHICP